MKLPNKKYDIIYADPPWSYDSKIRPCEKKLSHVSEHYNTMSTDEICCMPIQNIAEDNSLLFMWVSSPLLPDGMMVMNCWGFEYKTIVFVWDKINVVPGSYTMSSVEICIVGKKGNIPQPRGTRNTMQYLRMKKAEHSKKPPEFRKRIGEMFPTQKKIELFARKNQPLIDTEFFDGWDLWGNEIKK